MEQAIANNTSCVNKTKYSAAINVNKSEGQALFDTRGERRMSLWPRIAAQFGKPTGMLGKLAGTIMANRPSNVERIEWAVSMLELQATDQVLEIGFGPGVAIQKMADIATNGTVWGIDHSVVMLNQAARKNLTAIAAGRVRLMLASISDKIELPGPVDRILDINSFQFWEQPVENLEKCRGLLRAGGRIFLVHQPRKPGATKADADDAAARFSGHLAKAGYAKIEIRRKAMKPVPTICAIGTA
jgi:SAM-dependent methyltransferase